ncbi:hypothetical protein [Deinococcus sp. Leaf326]|uniref:hypothetical protein n=1 Tax=Deinococcus sp. Leaf326 TaxID=1736338 RepID=UPI0006F362DE|nr:hypothetical protein [Deinococcus sp. Leaf326]KQQ98662.1 hypothetical protein ASF71_21985 [Deinococcus sp. Leaf326]
MPIWLRALGILVCLAPLIAGLTSLALGSEDTREFLGGLIFILLLLFFVLLLILVVALAPPICWGLGWRPGAAGGSGSLVLIGFAFLLGNSDSDRALGGLLMLHIPLLGLLVWEWRGAIRRRQSVVAALAARSMDEQPG